MSPQVASELSLWQLEKSDVAVPILNKALGEGPRAAAHGSLSHGPTHHKGMSVSPLDVVAESLCEGGRWSTAALTLADAVSEAVLRGAKREARAQKNKRKAALRSQRLETKAKEKELRRAAALALNGKADEEEDEEEEEEDEEEEREVEILSHSGSLFPLWKAPYSAILSLAQDERHLASTLLVILAAADVGSLGGVTPDFASRALNHIAASSHHQDDAGSDDQRTRFRLLCGSISASGGLGPLAVHQRLTWLAANGLAVEENGGLFRVAAEASEDKKLQAIPLRFSKPWRLVEPIL